LPSLPHANADRLSRVARDGEFVHFQAAPPAPATTAMGGRWDAAMGSQQAMHRDVAAEPAADGRSIQDDAPLKLEQFLPYQLNVVASLVSQALSQVYARRYRIGVPEWRVLVTLGQYGVMTGKAIGSHTHMHKTKVSRAVALLEKRRLVVRRSNRADMRESFLSLTSSGRAMYEELAPHALDFARRLTDILTPSDREAFDRAVRELTARSAQLVAEMAEEGEKE
jgi:DNA-binding MarR family transcriptional regulator